MQLVPLFAVVAILLMSVATAYYYFGARKER